jgi:phosphate-selective porin OprO and OprP
MNLVRFGRSRWLTVLLAATVVLPAQAQNDSEIDELRQQVRSLREQLEAIERKLAEREERSGSSEPTAPSVSTTETTRPQPSPSSAPAVAAASGRGYSITSADREHSLRIRALVQADTRLYLDGNSGNDTFVLRRGRFNLDGTINRFVHFQVSPEFGGSSINLQDASITLEFSPAVQFRAGRFKSPIGLEQLQSDSWAFFAERSLATNLVPNRDVGVTLGGDTFEKRLNYTVGVMNGAPDASSGGNLDTDTGKEFVARVFAEPFKAREDSPLRGLGVGLAGSYAPRHRTTAGLTSGYRTDGQQRMFAYASNVEADGEAWRVSPQAYLYSGPFGAMAEYVVSSVTARSGVERDRLSHHAWHLGAGYVLTGEDAAFGGVNPSRPFSPGGDGWGAFEVVGRVAQLDLDDATFPRFAAPGSNATEATSYAVGLNWYLSRVVRASFDYFHTDFKTTLPPTSLLLRQDERVIITRLQVSF